MTNILFASNNLAHWPGSTSGSTPGHYDSDRIPYSINFINGQALSSPQWLDHAGDETWIHFNYYCGDTQLTSEVTFFQAYDDQGNLLYALIQRFNINAIALELRLYDGATSKAIDLSGYMNDDVLSFMDFKHTSTAFGLGIDIYHAGALLGSNTFPANANNYGKPVRCIITAAFSTTQPFEISEFIVADGDTRNARLDLLRPAATGAYSQWQGLISSLADDDSTTGVLTTVAAQRHSMTLTAYGGAQNVSNLVAVSQTTRGQNSPTKLKHSVRLSLVDYDNALTHDVGFPLELKVTDFLLNPGTSLPWTAADLAAVEMGFISVA
jgi:hypothetical protein